LQLVWIPDTRRRNRVSGLHPFSRSSRRSRPGSRRCRSQRGQAIIFLVMEPYNRSRFVRFHSFQSIFFAVAWTVIWIALSFVGMIPVLGWATLVIWPLLGLGGLIIWIILLLKANQGQMFKLPIIGDMAEKQAGA
jgi:uncharacterized membrane protein